MALNKGSRSVYEFGPFRFDPLERLLLRDGEPVPLAPKVFDTLIALIENSGRLVDKEELMSNIYTWDWAKAEHHYLDDSPYVLEWLARAHAPSGNPVEANRLIDELAALSSHVYVDSYYLASVYAALGEKQQAIAQLEKARQERSCWLIRLRVDPLFDTLRRTPGFENVLMSVGGSV